jgi:hypothetical protein
VSEPRRSVTTLLAIWDAAATLEAEDESPYDRRTVAICDALGE